MASAPERAEQRQETGPRGGERPQRPERSEQPGHKDSLHDSSTNLSQQVFNDSLKDYRGSQQGQAANAMFERLGQTATLDKAGAPREGGTRSEAHELAQAIEKPGKGGNKEWREGMGKQLEGKINDPQDPKAKEIRTALGLKDGEKYDMHKSLDCSKDCPLAKDKPWDAKEGLSPSKADKFMLGQHDSKDAAKETLSNLAEMAKTNPAKVQEALTSLAAAGKEPGEHGNAKWRSEMMNRVQTGINDKNPENKEGQAIREALDPQHKGEQAGKFDWKNSTTWMSGESLDKGKAENFFQGTHTKAGAVDKTFDNIMKDQPGAKKNLDQLADAARDPQTGDKAFRAGVMDGVQDKINKSIASGDPKGQDLRNALGLKEGESYDWHKSGASDETRGRSPQSDKIADAVTGAAKGGGVQAGLGALESQLKDAANKPGMTPEKMQELVQGIRSQVTSQDTANGGDKDSGLWSAMANQYAINNKGDMANPDGKFHHTDMAGVEAKDKQWAKDNPKETGEAAFKDAMRDAFKDNINSGTYWHPHGVTNITWGGDRYSKEGDLQNNITEWNKHHTSM